MSDTFYYLKAYVVTQMNSRDYVYNYAIIKLYYIILYTIWYGNFILKSVTLLVIGLFSMAESFSHHVYTLDITYKTVTIMYNIQ